MNFVHHSALHPLFNVVGNPNVTSASLQEQLDQVDDDVSTITTEQGQTLLMAAVLSQSLEHATVMLPHSWLLAQDHQGMSALMWAVSRAQDVAMVELLANDLSGAQVNHEGQTALMIAAALGHEKSMARVLAVSDPKRKDHQGRTALMHAAMQGNAAKIKTLLDVSHPNAQDIQGNTALMYAAAHGNLEQVQALRAVSEPLLRNHLSRTALDEAIERERWDLVDALASTMPQHTVAIALKHVQRMSVSDSSDRQELEKIPFAKDAALNPSSPSAGKTLPTPTPTRRR